MSCIDRHCKKGEEEEGVRESVCVRVLFFLNDGGVLKKKREETNKKKRGGGARV